EDRDPERVRIRLHALALVEDRAVAGEQVLDDAEQDERVLGGPTVDGPDQREQRGGDAEPQRQGTVRAGHGAPRRRLVRRPIAAPTKRSGTRPAGASDAPPPGSEQRHERGGGEGGGAVMTSGGGGGPGSAEGGAGNGGGVVRRPVRSGRSV